MGGRLVASGIALFLLLTFVFFAISLLPGDAAQMLLGRDAPPEAIAALRTALGLDLPVYQRYFHWLWQILHGDFGQSVSTGRPISSFIYIQFANTILLALFAAVISIPIAIVLGVLSALYKNSFFDRALAITSLTTVSFPDFFVAYTLILFLSVRVHLFPAIADVGSDTTLGSRIYMTFLPALTLTLFATTHMVRMTRAAILDVLSRPFIEMARLKGLHPLTIILRHALPNAWAPIINVIVFNLGYLITGVIIVEVVFAYPGLGQLLVDSVSKRDIPVVQACCFIFAATFVCLNLLADIIAICANPKLRRLS